MPKRPPTRSLLLDPCVLIDYAEADSSVLGKISARVASVFVTRPAFDEADQISADDASRLGVVIVDVDPELAATAARRAGALSFQDRLCMLLAQRERWTFVTNDGSLRKPCSADGISLMWGLEVMALAVRAGAMTAKHALGVAKAIHARNPRYVTQKLVAAFARKIGD